jgi:hypothetical protein
MNVAVNRLTLRGACDAPHHQAFLIEDALNTQLSAENRLVLVRTLSLLPIGATDTRPRDTRFLVADRVASSWTRTMSGACHGGADGAGSANTVWFHDAAEAKAILLARLMKGQSVDGWFWRLAVKLWQGQPLAHWIADELIADPPEAQGSGAVALLERLLADGQIETAEAAISHYLQLSAGFSMRFAAGSPFSSAYDNWPMQPSEHIVPPTSVGAIAEHLEHKLVLRLQAALPSALVAMLRRLNGNVSQRTALIALTVKCISRVAPELQLHPVTLKNAAQQILLGAVPDAPAKRIALSTSVQSKSDDNRGIRGDRQAVKADVTRKEKRKTKTPKRVTTDELVLPEIDPATQFEASFDDRVEIIALSEQRSAAAGLFFVVNVLRELDWPAWLAARQEHLACNPTAQLLRYIATRHRVDPRDPVFAVLAERLRDQEPIDPELLNLWRTAIDRWLRRNARMNLAMLVKRQGWLNWRDDRLAVRFTLQSIDMRLRRVALDRDPGWTPWARISIRYHFNDQPYLGDTGT